MFSTPARNAIRPKKNPGAAAVAQADQLSERHGAGLPEPVDAPARERHQHAGHRRQEIPPLAGESGLVVHLPVGEDRDRAHGLHRIRAESEVASHRAAGDEEAGNAMGVGSAPPPDDERHQEECDEDGPVGGVQIHDAQTIAAHGGRGNPGGDRMR
jgi:hypothetical protein